MGNGVSERGQDEEGGGEEKWQIINSTRAEGRREETAWVQDKEGGKRARERKER